MVLETLIGKIKQTTAEIPTEVKHFVIKGALILLGWCLLYGLLLKPYNLVDPTLTKYTGKATVWLMQNFYHGQQTTAVYNIHAVVIYINNRQVLSIWDPCNALDLYVLFSGFMLCVPMGVKKTTAYILVGIISIFILNILRCLALVYLFYNHFGYTDIAHHYFFQLIVYAAIFLIWERYFKSFKGNNEAAKI
jgi:exosortase family protein XrtF